MPMSRQSNRAAEVHGLKELKRRRADRLNIAMVGSGMSAIPTDWLLSQSLKATFFDAADRVGLGKGAWFTSDA